MRSLISVIFSELYPSGRYNVRLGTGDVLFYHTKNTSGKFRLRLRKRPHSGSGITEAKMQESERNNVKYLRNVFPDSQWERFRGMRGEAATFHPQSSAATNTKHT